MIDKDDWDRVYVHFCIDAYQSCQSITVACGIQLSTWAAADLPWKQSGNEYGTAPSAERDLGYSFRCNPVTCPECITYMEKTCNHCKICDILCVYDYCEGCATISLIKDGFIKE